LAYSIPEFELDIPNTDMSATSVAHDRFWGCRLAQKRQRRPACTFGNGLGYSPVSLHSQVPEQISIRIFNVKVEIQNVGANKTSRMAQIYTDKVERGPIDYERVLIGFARSSTLSISKSEEVEVNCRLDPVSHWNGSTNESEVEGGKYHLWVSQIGGDSAKSVSVQVPAIKWGVKKV
jgi:hypothetical protein